MHDTEDMPELQEDREEPEQEMSEDMWMAPLPTLTQSFITHQSGERKVIWHAAGQPETFPDREQAINYLVRKSRKVRYAAVDARTLGRNLWCECGKHEHINDWPPCKSLPCTNEEHVHKNPYFYDCNPLKFCRQ